MRIKFINVMALCGIFIFGCTSNSYLPDSSGLDVNQFGSLITVAINEGKAIKGELLAINGVQLVVLNKDTTHERISIIPINSVKHFKLRYAKSKHYGWTIPVSLIATIAHGWYLILTAPVSLIVTISVTSGGENAYTYSNKTMTFDKLKMFARFPQGIPPNIDLASIK